MPKKEKVDAKSAAKAAAKAGKKAPKKWSKGNVKDKLSNKVVFDTETYEKLMKEVPSYKLVTTSVISDRLKVNGSLARRALKELEKKGLIKRIVHHSAQEIYTRAIIKDEATEAAEAAAAKAAAAKKGGAKKAGGPAKKAAAAPKEGEETPAAAE